jgi:branched-chain amino acid transport system ATP-binding protein
MSGTPLLAVEDVYTFYGLSQVLFGVSLEVAAGECVCLLGRNGVGKTTTMRSIMGLTPPRQGRVIWKGRDVAGRLPYQIADLGIGFVPEDRRLYPHLTVWENLDVATRRRDGASSWTLERVFDLFPSCASWSTGRGISPGESSRCSPSRALSWAIRAPPPRRPSEPRSPRGGPPEGADRAPQAGGPDHPPRRAERGLLPRSRRRVYVLEKGHIRYHGTASAFREDESVRAQYLAL